MGEKEFEVMKTNIAELLKDCPRGMELDCTMYDNCTLEIIFEGCLYPIQIQTPEGLMNLTKYGSMSQNTYSKCVIFPKGKTTWEGFVPPCKFKDGDMVATKDSGWIGITVGGKSGRFIPTYCVLKSCGEFEAYFGKKEKWYFERFATEEEKAKLFDAIKANGYRWNSETKTLVKLIVEPKFKVGDRIKHIVGREEIATVVGVEKLHYNLDSKVGTSSFSISLQHEWELVPNKFDISTLKAFESRVLVRDYINQVWIPTFWGKRLEDDSNCCYLTTNGCYKYCIPYEGNEHLLGTINDCDPFFKTWEK